MPKSALTHDQFRSKVCLICFQKYNPKSLKNIVGVTLERVQRVYIENYDPSNQKLPNVICSDCRKPFTELIAGKELMEHDVPELIDFKTLSLALIRA